MRNGLTVVGVLLLISCATPPDVPPAALGELAPAGKLRAAINYGNAVLAVKDARTGELRGVTVEISRELGRRLAVPVELVGYDTVAGLMTGAKSGAWDVAFLAVDPARAADVAFTAPYMEVEVTYLVPAQSELRDVSEVDRAGVRIAVQEKNAADLFLSKELKHASLVRARDEAAVYGLLKSGTAEALASNKQRLLSAAYTNPAYRMLDGRFTTIPHAAAVPAGRSAAAQYLRRFLEELKASGFVARALQEAQLRGVVVTPR
jgi:polar amino acid transport system substrate-binding protein